MIYDLKKTSCSVFFDNKCLELEEHLEYSLLKLGGHESVFTIGNHKSRVLAIHLNEGLEISNLMYQDIRCRCVYGHDSLQKL